MTRWIAIVILAGATLAPSFVRAEGPRGPAVAHPSPPVKRAAHVAPAPAADVARLMAAPLRCGPPVVSALGSRVSYCAVGK